MIATHRLPRSTTKKGQKTRFGEPLLPQLSVDAPSGFVGLKTGRRYERGYIIHTGAKVTPESLLDDFCEKNTPPDNRVIALERLEAFVQALEGCKVGNLV